MCLRGIDKLISTALINPHSANILQETGSTINATFVGEVQLTAAFVDNGIAGLDSHKAPCARTEKCKILVVCRNSCNCTGCVMTCHSNNWDSSITGYLLHLWGKCTDDRSWHSHLTKFTSLDTKTGKQVGIKVLGYRIENLGR